jgi:hypothetical protein
MGVTQSGNPHGTGKSTLKAFAAECGVTDMSMQNTEIFASTISDDWRSVPVTSVGTPEQTRVARVWRDTGGHVRVVDVSWSNTSGDVLQMSRMCFSVKGSIRKVQEHYVNIPSCACGREVELAYEEQGKQTKREQQWYKVPSHEAIAPPVGREKFNPGVIEFRSVAALPFANLLKEKNASSH